MPAAAANTPTLAPWEFAGLMLTYGCTARCAFCYVNATPEQQGFMSVEAALHLWRGLDEFGAAARGMRVHLAGGEPFLDWDRLVAILRAAREARLSRPDKIETNAFWATDDAVTRARLEQLADLGVEKLVLSADVFHQEHVPFERVQRAVRLAREVFGSGRLIVRWWDFFNAPVLVRGLPPEQKRAAYRAALARHPERLTGRAARELAPLLPRQSPDAFAGENCSAAVLGSRHVHIDPYGHVFPGTCAGIILGRVRLPGEGGDATGAPSGDAFLSVRALWEHLHANWRAHPVLSALAAGGSHELLNRVRPLGYVARPGYATKCHLCSDLREFLAARGVWPAHVGPRACYGDATVRAPAAG